MIFKPPLTAATSGRMIFAGTGAIVKAAATLIDAGGQAWMTQVNIFARDAVIIKVARDLPAPSLRMCQMDK